VYQPAIAGNALYTSKPATQIGKIGISYNNLTLLTNLWFLCDEIQLG
jgi:hypothetical protein